MAVMQLLHVEQLMDNLIPAIMPKCMFAFKFRELYSYVSCNIVDKQSKSKVIDDKFVT